MKYILILGANGFVGTHISLALQSNPTVHCVLACRNQSKLLDDLKSNEIREGDLRDTHYLQSLFNDIDIVINAFAWTSMYSNQQISQELFLKPTINLINTAKKAGVRRFINLSTISAASSDQSHDANSPGILRSFWPHLDNVVRIEDHLRSQSSESFQVINLRCGLFIGEHYALGLLPILLPRLKTHLVPLVNGGNTDMPLISGKDIAQAFVKAAMSKATFRPYEGFNIIGPSIPSVKEVLHFISDHFSYPYPHFSVPFTLAYPFAYLMELLDHFVPYEPLVTRSIIHLLENTHTDNEKASTLLGYTPVVDWKDALSAQIRAIEKTNEPMKMVKEYE